MKVGRPSLLSETIATKIIELYGEGKTDKQVAKIIGVHENTVNKWRKENLELQWSAREAKAKADEIVEASLFHRAVGYSHPEEKVFCNNGAIITHQTTKHYPPDTQAVSFWLKNRRPKRWRERVEVELAPARRLVIKASDQQKLLAD